MSFALPPSVTKAGAPGVTDDASKGFVVGSSVVDTSASPRTIYFCTDATIGAAVWKLVPAGGGATDHALLTNLAFAASGHTGATTSVAAFDGTGAAQTVQATTNETMLVRRAGTLQWVPIIVAALTFSGLTGSTPGTLTFPAYTPPTFSGLGGSIPSNLSLDGLTITTGVFS